MKYLIKAMLLLVLISPVRAKGQVFNLDSLIGKEIPNYSFDLVKNYSSDRISLQEFRGQWLVLDFWNKGCTACVSSFPHINRLEKELDGQCKFLLVCEKDKEGESEPLFERCVKKMNLKLACAFDNKLFDIIFKNNGGVPKVCVVDPKGIIRYAGNGVLSAEKLNQILTSKDKKAMTEKPIDPVSKIIYQSSISHSSLLYGSPDFIASEADRGKVSLGARSLSGLYFFAVLGSNSPYNVKNPNTGERWKRDEFFKDAILEVSDIDAFKVDGLTAHNYYDYNLQVPIEKATTENLMHYLQQDLMRYFGYEATVEKRKLPYLRLVATKHAYKKLKAKGDSTYFYASKAGVFKIKNQPIRNTILAEATDRLAVIDETGIQGNIDIEFTIVPTSFEDYKRALRENGLDLIEGEKEMYCLVIRDPKAAVNTTNIGK